MAKAGQLAGLAALGALAYMNRDKLGFGSDATKPSATAAENDASQARINAQRNAMSGNMGGPDTGDELDRLKKRYGSTTGTTTAGPAAPPNLDVKPAPAPAPALAPKSADNLTAIAYPRMPGSFQGQNLPAKTVEEAEKNEADAKLVAKSAQAQANKAANAKDIKTASTKYSTATDQYKNLSRAAAVTDARKRAANTLKRQTQLSPFKKGGSVSSASKRADGIASRGKTKCKMY